MACGLLPSQEAQKRVISPCLPRKTAEFSFMANTVTHLWRLFLVSLSLAPGATLQLGRVPSVQCAQRAWPRLAQTPDEVVDPRQAVQQLGSLLEQVKDVWTEGKSWSAEERVARRRQIVSTYVSVFAPAMAFSGVQLALSISAFLLALLGLSISGRGYADVVQLCGGIPVLQGMLEQLDPSWGNAAIALLAVEASAPLLLAAALAASPPATRALQNK